MAVVKKIQTRDYLRNFITKINKEAGVVFNASKLNSVKECENYILKLVRSIKTEKKDDNKALYKEIDALKEEIEFKNKEIAINEENIEVLNSKIIELRREIFEQSNFKADFILEAQKNKTELELQKIYKQVFAGALIVSMLLNIFLIWGEL